jgi:hypothetical protein
MRRIARELEGVDVYYRGEIYDDTYWGRMYIQPFPFVCVLVYDVSEKPVEIHDHSIGEFIRQNIQEAQIVEARKVRRKLRCLDGEQVHFEFTKEILPMNVLSIGRRTVSCKCSNGFLQVRTHSNDMFCHGFEVVIDYSDGVYVHDGRTYTGQHVVLTNADLGLEGSFSMNADLRRLFEDPRNAFLITAKEHDLKERMTFYRDDLEEERRSQELTLSHAFWALVYNNHYLPPAKLQELLDTRESNPALKKIMRNRKADFQSLYARLRYFDAHPALGYWYTFWDDVYTNNMFMRKLEQHSEFFDLSSKWAIAYNPVSVPQLKENLEILGLRKKNGKGLFSDRILDKLEAKLTELGAADVRPLRTYVLPGSASALKDPRGTNSVILPENAVFLAQAAAITE